MTEESGESWAAAARIQKDKKKKQQNTKKNNNIQDNKPKTYTHLQRREKKNKTQNKVQIQKEGGEKSPKQGPLLIEYLVGAGREGGGNSGKKKKNRVKRQVQTLMKSKRARKGMRGRWKGDISEVPAAKK